MALGEQEKSGKINKTNRKLFGREFCLVSAAQIQPQVVHMSIKTDLHWAHPNPGIESESRKRQFISPLYTKG